jgi:hypothetical protein
MQIFKSKFFWITLLGILINALQYVITNNVIPEYTVLITSIIAILQIVATAIAGMVQTAQVNNLKAKIARMK